MSFYFLAVIDKHDTQRYAEYSAGNVPILSGLDVKIHAVTDAVTTQEGEFDATTVVLLEFPNGEEFRKWWDSAEYAAIKPIRQAASDVRFAVTFGQDS